MTTGRRNGIPGGRKRWHRCERKSKLQQKLFEKGERKAKQGGVTRSGLNHHDLSQYSFWRSWIRSSLPKNHLVKPAAWDRQRRQEILTRWYFLPLFSVNPKHAWSKEHINLTGEQASSILARCQGWSQKLLSLHLLSKVKNCPDYILYSQ